VNTQYETILVNKYDRWVRLILNRPEVKNALSEKMTLELLSVLEDLKDDNNIRGVSIEGAGDAFCAGADLKDFRKNFVLQTPEFDQVRSMNLEAGKLFKKLSQLPKIVVALVHGPAFAGGLGMVACADIVAVTEEARFSLSETAIGLTPAQISPFLIKRLGLRIASKLMLTGLEFGAKEAIDFGLADKLVKNKDGLDEFFKGFDEATRKCAPMATAATKEILSFSRDSSLEELSDFASGKFAECMLGEEAKEGLAAFAEKRKPYWYGA